MHPFKIIKTRKEHRAALGELEKLIQSNPPPRSPESDRIELLALLVETYEKRHFPIPPPDPVEAILFRMDQSGITRSDLVPLLGSRSKVSEVLARKRPLSLAMIRALHRALGIPVDILMGEGSETAPA